MEHGVLFYVLTVVALLSTASVVAVVSRRLRLPYSILLVLAGLAIGFAGDYVPAFGPFASFRIKPDLVLFVFLPVLLFESSFNLDARNLVRNIPAILLLAVPGLLVSMTVTGVAVHYLTGVSIGVALLFGCIVSATDPVAVVGVFREMGAPKKLGLIVEGESLFNDGTALVVFKVTLGIIAAGTLTFSSVVHGAGEFVFISAGGALAGLATGMVFARIIDTVYNDEMVEVTLTIVLAYGTFILAEEALHVSGVIATVTAGLTMGSYGRMKISPSVLKNTETMWGHLSFISNSLIFLLVGLSIDLGALAEIYPVVLGAFAAMLAGRALAVFGLFPAVQGLFRFLDDITPAFKAVIVWGGLRGALAIVMTLSLPDGMQHKQQLINLTIGIVLVSIVLNGLTVKRLMVWLGLDRYSAKEGYRRVKAMLEVKEKAAGELATFGWSEALSPQAITIALESYRKDLADLAREAERLKRTVGERDESELLMTHCLMLERMLYLRAFERGLLKEDNLRSMLVSIERQLDRLKGGDRISMPRTSSSVGLFRMLYGLPFVGRMAARLKTVSLAAEYEKERARLDVTNLVLRELERLSAHPAYSADAVEVTRGLYAILHEKAEARVRSIIANYPEYVTKADAGILQRYILNFELDTYRKMHDEGEISDKVLAEFNEVISHRIKTMRMRPVEELNLPPRRLIEMVDIFDGLDASTLEYISSKCKVHAYGRGEIMVEQGEELASMFIVGRGEAELVHEGKDGVETVIARLVTGSHFGEGSLIRPGFAGYTARAATQCTVLELDRDDLMARLDVLPMLSRLLAGRGYRGKGE